MKIQEYLGITLEKFLFEYVDTRLVDVAEHPEFPLQLLTYGREAVHTNNWDSVIRKCRGVIYNTETKEVIARPFEKFFNLKTANMPETDPSNWQFDGNLTIADPEVWEKMDGFMLTAYEYNGQTYIASKGSFDSPHAKWSTAWYRANVGVGHWPKGYTPVFEGINPNLRIVVDYGGREEMVLLALIDIETGEEMSANKLRIYAQANGLRTPIRCKLSWQEAAKRSLDEDVENFEGYVLVWRRPGQTPFRLKVKYVDYLRLHRMVSGVSAKAIYRGLSDPTYAGELREWIDESTPWFSKFVAKWVRALQGRHDELLKDAQAIFERAQTALKDFSLKNWDNPANVRKAYALEFSRWPDVKGILFALYDGKDASAVAWKLTKPLIHKSQPMIHGKDML